MALAGFGDSVEGYHAVRRRQRPRRVEELWVEASRARQPDFAALVAIAEEHGARVRVVDDVTEFASTSTPQGVVARASTNPLEARGRTAGRSPAGVDGPRPRARSPQPRGSRPVRHWPPA